MVKCLWLRGLIHVRTNAMCLGIPGRILSVCDGVLRTGRVDFGGVAKEICLAYVPEANVGDYVIVHVGFAISRVEEAEAARVFGYLEEIEALSELAPPDHADATRSDDEVPR